MAANAMAPVAVGTRGTVGSLIRKEIEYFRKIELSDHGRFQKLPTSKISDEEASRCYKKRKVQLQQRPSSWFFGMSWKRKRQRVAGEGGFLPKMCSVVGDTDKDRSGVVRGFSYMILNDEFDKNLRVV